MEEARDPDLQRGHLLGASGSGGRTFQGAQPYGGAVDAYHPSDRRHERGAFEAWDWEQQQGGSRAWMPPRLQQNSRRSFDDPLREGEARGHRQGSRAHLGKEPRGRKKDRSRRARRVEKEGDGAAGEGKGAGERRGQEREEEEKRKGEEKGKIQRQGARDGKQCNLGGEQEKKDRRACSRKEESHRDFQWDGIRPQEQGEATSAGPSQAKAQERQEGVQRIQLEFRQRRERRLDPRKRCATRSIEDSADCSTGTRGADGSRHEDDERAVDGSGGILVRRTGLRGASSPTLHPELLGQSPDRRSPQRMHEPRDDLGFGPTRTDLGEFGRMHPTAKKYRGRSRRGYLASLRETGTATQFEPPNQEQGRNGRSAEGAQGRCTSSFRSGRQSRERLGKQWRRIKGKGKEPEQRRGERRQRQEEGQRGQTIGSEETPVGAVEVEENLGGPGWKTMRKEEEGGSNTPVVACGNESKGRVSNKEMTESGMVDDLQRLKGNYELDVLVGEMVNLGEEKRTADPVKEAGTFGFTGAFGIPAEEAATSSEKTEDPLSIPGKNSRCGFTRTGGFVEVVKWLGSRVEDFFISRCKVKPTGRIFPLPSSISTLQSVLSHSFKGDWMVLRILVLSLNSLNGEGLDHSGKVSDLQRKVLDFLGKQAEFKSAEVLDQDPATWSDFFRVRTVDYQGEEVKTAQAVEWANIAPALPKEVGSVKLRDVVGMGCRHYVDNFPDYLVPEEDQQHTKAPKVMVPMESWDELCEGLLASGVCGLIPEEQVHRVEGKLLLNGMFGVSKGEFQGGIEIMRLIMNLIPLNGICKSVEGDVATLPAWSGMSAFQLHPQEDLVVSSEDVRCFFYIFSVPESWYPYLAFNRPVSTKVTGQGGERMYLCSKVLPMGFKNSVSLAQHVHRFVVHRALKRGEEEIGAESEVRKDRVFSSSRNLFRIYLDNFDELRKVNRGMAEAIEGKVTPLVAGLREEYLEWGIPRHPKKSVAQRKVAEVQGAIVDGDRGTASPKPDKVLKYVQLGCELLAAGKSTVKQAQVVGGGFVYLAMFRRPLLGGLNAIWRFITSFSGLPPFIQQPLPGDMAAEIARFVGLVPLAYMDFRCDISSRVTASDASEFGGGVCVSRGLTPNGCIAAKTRCRGDVFEPEDGCPVLTIGLFDGIGALRVAADCLGWTVVGHISVESDPQASRVLESQFPQCVCISDVRDVNQEMVQDWAARFGQVALVLLGAGPPCQGVSGLNADRQGALKDSRSNLFVHVPRIKELVKRCFPWAQVRSLMESVASMDEKDREIMSEAFGDIPWQVDAGIFSLARRPRLYWLDWELHGDSNLQLAPADGSQWKDVGKITGQVEVVASEYLHPGWSLVGDKLPTFTTSRPRTYPGRKPAGLKNCQAHEVERWQKDSHRFPPYQYVDANMLINKAGEYRLPDVEEREAILGFPRGYTLHCCKKSEQGTEHHQDKRLSLLGNTWNVTVVTWLLGQLGFQLGMHEQVDSQNAVERTKPGCQANLQTFLRRPLMKRLKKMYAHPTWDKELVGKLMTLVSMKGEDLLLQASSEDVVHYHRLRASIPANLWKWSTAASWRWTGQKEHINVLEMRAVLCSLRWRLERQHHITIKFVHLIDSQVCLHALSRGRSSSRKLRRTLLRINSLLLATGSHVLWTYVHTKQNPADAPSRRAGKKKVEECLSVT